MKRDCEKIKSLLLEISEKDKELKNLPQNITKHIEKCEDCKNFKNGLLLSKKLFFRQKLYTKSLKEKTLREISFKVKKEKESLPLKIIPISIISVLFSLIIPIFSIFKLTGYIFSNFYINLFISLFIYLSIGFITSLFTLLIFKSNLKKYNGVKINGRS